MSKEEKVLYESIVRNIKDIMGINAALPMVAYGRLKQLHNKYGLEKLNIVLNENRDKIKNSMSKVKFESNVHQWWYLDKIICSDIKLITDIDEYII